MYVSVQLQSNSLWTCVCVSLYPQWNCAAELDMGLACLLCVCPSIPSGIVRQNSIGDWLVYYVCIPLSPVELCGRTRYGTGLSIMCVSLYPQWNCAAELDRGLACLLCVCPSIPSGIVRQNSIWDWLVFRKVQNYMGGRLRFIITGSAPISTKVLDFLRVAFGCNVRQLYLNLSHKSLTIMMKWGVKVDATYVGLQT